VVEDQKSEVLAIMLAPILSISITIFLNCWVTTKHHSILGKKADRSDEFLRVYHEWRRASICSR